MLVGSTPRAPKKDKPPFINRMRQKIEHIQHRAWWAANHFSLHRRWQGPPRTTKTKKHTHELKTETTHPSLPKKDAHQTKPIPTSTANQEGNAMGGSSLSAAEGEWECPRRLCRLTYESLHDGTDCDGVSDWCHKGFARHVPNPVTNSNGHPSHHRPLRPSVHSVSLSRLLITSGSRRLF